MMRLLMVLTVLVWVAVGLKVQSLEEQKGRHQETLWYQETGREMDSLLKQMEEIDV